MQNQDVKKLKSDAAFLFISGCLGLIGVTIFDILYWRTGILIDDNYPNFSQGYIIRSIVIFASVTAILWTFIGKKKPTLMLGNNYKFPVEILFILGTLSISFIFLFLFVSDPIIFSMASLEDRLIEWSSALLSFGSAIIVAISFLKYRNNLNIPKTTKVSLALLSLVFFLIAMEEVSWFQRLLHLKTAKIFDGNQQDEMNLHNFATDFIENIYYMGAHLFFVVLPFFYLLYPSLSDKKYLRLFIARPFITVIGTVSCAYTFEMWNVSLMQISFFSGIIILLFFTVCSTSKHERFLIALTIILVMVTQGLFLMKGEETFLRLWEISEYKEFFIPLTSIIYSLDLSMNISRVYFPEES